MLCLKRVVLIALCFLLLVGCDILSFSVDSLLSAPDIADNQAAISEVLEKELGKSITPVYPQNGEYRSAFIVDNFDSDSGLEAVAFYISNEGRRGIETNNVRVGALNQNDDGTWSYLGEAVGAGDLVERVIISNHQNFTDIVIGYGSTAYEESFVGIYRFTDGVPALIHGSSYEYIERLDLDGCGYLETVILSNRDETVSVQTIKTFDGLNYKTSECALSTEASQILGCKLGNFGDTIGLYIDIMDNSGKAVTQVVCFEGGNLVSPTSQDESLLDSTKRFSSYRATDYDSDGTVEIPIAMPMAGYYDLLASEAEYITYWLSYDADFGIFEAEAAGYYSLQNSYTFCLPNRWLNLVTVKTNQETGIATFVKYDPKLNVDEMQELMSIAAVDQAEVLSYIEEGYINIVSADGTEYMYKKLAEETEPLLLTVDEIKNNFYCINP